MREISVRQPLSLPDSCVRGRQGENKYSKPSFYHHEEFMRQESQLGWGTLQQPQRGEMLTMMLPQRPISMHIQHAPVHVLCMPSELEMFFVNLCWPGNLPTEC